jgi:hypothetical protein
MSRAGRDTGVGIETPKAQFQQDASGTGGRIQALLSELLIRTVKLAATGDEPDASCRLVLIGPYLCCRAVRASAATSRQRRERLLQLTAKPIMADRRKDSVAPRAACGEWIMKQGPDFL